MALKLLPAKPRSLANSCSTLAISSQVSKIRAKVFGSSSICFHRMKSPLPETISDLQKTEKDSRSYYFKGESISVIRFRIKPLLHRYRRRQLWNRRGRLAADLFL